ncbi:fumarylacetoacetate hydrolase family protein [Thermaerobacter subterraneus]|uniref:2-keto-4-pentenoate hydratase/2-oxohepta-3-ene-1,7-dioic acid hydratase n=1 Tax=Thermaerobacter subterraneus DSM 13965 TaxID=867903 RepID=K6P3Y8_9FIRM|nr:fumarylacetoacetate hydrolase family protein [Thermaerobacter subterraneus]EKP95765.1 2-keto-4-pentenoate hydratase/2-oxohepta-3-ene-1,7-dioic acid hydratase [Thermaerobacter subterraneus DSM 13965]
MRFVRFERAGQVRIGLAELDEQGRLRRVLDLGAAQARWGGPPVPEDMVAWIALGDEAVAAARRWWERAAGTTGDDAGSLWHPGDGVRLLAPIARPPKNVFAIGLNYRDHVFEISGRDVPQHPVVFTKAASAVQGPGDPIYLHPGVTEAVDYEGELAVVIGRRGRSIPRERAREHIFGYMILNDVTARDLQRRTSQWHLGKSLDTFCPTGPCLVHRDAVGWPVEVDVRTWVNGELRQEANTRQLIFDIPTLLATISAGITLEPGDIIATGTPSGVGMGFDPPRFLRAGDVVEIEIAGLGRLRNPVVDRWPGDA